MNPFDVAVVAIVVGGLTQVARVFAQHRAARPTDAGAALAPALDERLRRMEQALEAVAVEVERISEGQRFTTRLLAERGTGATAPPAVAAAGPPVAPPAWAEATHAGR